MKNELFFDVLSRLIQQKLNEHIKLTNPSFNRKFCFDVYQIIFNSFTDILKISQEKLSNSILTNEAVNYCCQWLYDNTKINGNQALDPTIFTQRASIDNIPVHELNAIIMLFECTELAEIAIKKIQGKSIDDYN